MLNRIRKSRTFLPHLTLRDGGVLMIGLVVFVTIAASTVTKFSIWFDEAFGSYLIRFNFFDLTRYTAFDVHPPLYYWLLKAWSLVFGNTELGIRSFSVFFGAVTIIGMFMLALKLFGRKAAYVSLIFLVLSPVFIRYSQEARMYTLLTAIIVAATYVLVYAQQAKRRSPWIVYGVLLALGMLTQYFAALAWLSHWAWRAYVIRQQKKGEFKKRFFTRNWVVAHVVAIGIFLPWLPWMVRQFADVQGNGFWIPAVTSMTVPDFLTHFLLFSDHSGVTSWSALAFYAIVVVIVGVVIVTIRRLEGKARDNYMLLMCMVCVPVLLLLVLSMPPLRSAFVDRYLIVSVLFLALLIGVSMVEMLSVVRLRLVVIASAIIVVMMSVGIYNQSVIGNYNFFTHQSNNARQMIERIRTDTPTDVPIVAATPWVFYESVIYERPQSPIYFMDESTTYEYGSLRMLQENSDHKIMDITTFAAHHSSFWLVANINGGGQVRPPRDNWKVLDTITINDSRTGTPLLRAIRVSAE